jgi:two-component system, OmpR family, sensor histidine kinase BaeS
LDVAESFSGPLYSADRRGVSVFSNTDRDTLQDAISSFHHDAATPIAVISGVLELLRDPVEGLPAEAVALLDSASRSAEVLQGLLDQLRIADTGQVLLVTQSVELVQLARDLVADLRGTLLAEHRGQVDDPYGAVTVEADPARLRQALTNLLSNAVNYSEAGTAIHLHVLTRDDHVEIWVTDEGSGIAPEDLVRIFERYERAGTSHGLGLGLYVTQRIVEAHGGHLHAEPAPEGPGSQFVMQLPSIL